MRSVSHCAVRGSVKPRRVRGTRACASTTEAPPKAAAPESAAPASTTAQTFTVRVSVPFGSSVKVCGAAPELGTWNAEEAVPLTWATGDIWSATVDINDDHTSSQWKLIIAREDGETEWENCDNRILTLGEEVNVLFAGRGEPTPEAEVASEEQAATGAESEVEEASTVSSNGHAEAAVPTASSKDSASEEADEHLSSPPPPSKSAASPAAGKVPDLEEVVKSGSKAPAEAGGSAAAGWPWK